MGETKRDVFVLRLTNEQIRGMVRNYCQGVCGFEESLINYYGKDYLTPPPMAERKPSHQGMLRDINNE